MRVYLVGGGGRCIWVCNMDRKAIRQGKSGQKDTPS